MNDHLDLRVEGISKHELATLLEEVGVSSGVTIDEPKNLIGQEHFELLFELSKIELNALSLVVGYLLGKGVRISAILAGRLENLKDLKDAIRRIRIDKKSADLRGLHDETK